MIHECALDPKFLEKILDQRLAKNRIINAFKPGTCYIRSGYPNNLKQVALSIIDRKLECAKSEREKIRLQKKKLKLSTILAALPYRTAKRLNYPVLKDTIINEHKRLPFHKIITSNANYPGDHITYDMLIGDKEPFDLEPSMRVKRQPKEMLHCLAPLLMNASKVSFVDPFFFPNNQFKRTYSIFLTTISKVNDIRVKAGKRNINIICSYEKAIGSNSRYNFILQCKEILPTWITGSTTLFIYPIKELKNNQELHNRYILTDIGGVMFGHGTDSSKDEDSTTCDDVNILQSTQYNELENIYTPFSSSFAWQDPITITPANR